MLKKIKNNTILFGYTIKLIYKINKKNFLLSIAFSSLNGVFPILTLLTSQYIINEIQLLEKPFRTIVSLIIVYFLISIVGTIFQSLSSYNLGKLSNELQYGINRIVMEKCGDMSLEMLEKTETYDTITRLEQEIAIKPYQTLQSLMTIFSSTATLISASAIILSWNVWIEMILVILSLSMCIGQIIIGNKEFFLKYNRSNKEREAWYYSYLLTHDTAFKEVKAYGLKKYFIKRYASLSSLFISQTNYIEKIKTILNLAISFFQDIFGLITMVMAINMAYTGKIMIGTAMSYLNAITMIQTSTNSLATAVYSIYNSNLYMGMLRDFLNNHEGIEKDEDNAKEVAKIETIEFKNVYFDYPEFQNVLKEISIKLNKKEKVAIVGKNGSGKSTLFKILCGLYSVKNGNILVNGKDLKNISIESYRKNISVLFQDFIKFEGTVKENIRIANIDLAEDERALNNALEKANVDFLKKDKSYDLNKTLGNWFDNGSQLSGGQWQKMALARVYYREADVYLLDEPSSALDVMAETEIFNNFFEISKNKIAVYITHRVKIAKNATKIIVMDSGRIVGVGSHEKLMDSCAVYKEMYDKEIEKN